ncbi:MAG: hypothetical protein ACR2PG_08880 [Hyphomicrobiaceae bacterium]
MDLDAIGTDLGRYLPSSESLILLAVLAITLALFYFSSGGRKLWETLARSVLSNWRLALLGATGIVLSLASGWTTWDGMRNFTQEPLLSLMITFGIQGVMLIVAWLIGESFATGMNFRPGKTTPPVQDGGILPSVQTGAGTVIGILLFVGASILILNQVGVGGTSRSGLRSETWISIPSGLLIASMLILVMATLLLHAGKDIVGDYLRALRVIVRSAVLWIMFLGCMTTSVFFSFDSLFSTIFPKEERARAAELRAQNQVAGVVNDIGTLAALRRIEERDRFFESDAWKTYDRTLENLVSEARTAPAALQTYFEKKMRDRQQVIAHRQEERAAAQGQQGILSQQVSLLNSKVARAKAVITQLAPVVEDLRSKSFAKDREIVAKNAEAEAEAGGIGVTARVGRGPKFREIAGELRVLREQRKNLQLQLRDYEQRLTASRTELSRGEAELSTTQGEIAKLKSRAQTASRLIALTQQSGESDASRFDPTDWLRQLERTRVNFRQEPTQQRLTTLQNLCSTLVGAMVEVPSLKVRAREINCDPGQASEAAERVFALNAGLEALAARCIGGDKLPKGGGADALFRFARQCVQDAGIPSENTSDLRAQINYLELNRDDKAHRFVVTTNAFQDGNKLAYLALAIAIAIDALVFMSGLFGANAVRSPLSDVPSHKARSAQHLEAIIDTALKPHTYETARLVLAALRPITPNEGFTGEIVVEDDNPHAAELRRVLNAGTSIGAVRHRDDRDRLYQVRSELFEYLSIVAKREFDRDENRVSLAELERTVSVALLPDVQSNAELVLSFMHPIIEQHGFMAEIKLSDVRDPMELRIVLNALNAGVAYQRVQPVKTGAKHFYIHADYFKILTNLRGRLVVAGGLRSDPIPAEMDELSADQPPRSIDDTATQRLSDQRHDTGIDIARDARHSMLKALKFDEVQLDDCLRRAEVVDGLANESYDRLVRQSDKIVADRLTKLMDTAVDQLSRVERNLLDNRYSDIEDAEIHVRNQRETIEFVLSALILAPGGQYLPALRDIVRRLRSGDQSEVSRDVLDRLQNHTEELGRAVSSADVLHAIDNYLTEASKPNVVRLDESNRHSA